MGFLLWAPLPYLFCTLASCFSPTRVAAIAAVVVVLTFDVFVHYSVWTSKSSTAAIAYIYSPVWNILVFAPLALLLAWLVVRRRASEQNPDGVP
jgi:membrane protein implicated in regulation of membrane protease activity